MLQARLNHWPEPTRRFVGPATDLGELLNSTKAANSGLVDGG